MRSYHGWYRVNTGNSSPPEFLSFPTSSPPHTGNPPHPVPNVKFWKKVSCFGLLDPSLYIEGEDPPRPPTAHSPDPGWSCLLVALGRMRVWPRRDRRSRTQGGRRPAGPRGAKDPTDAVYHGRWVDSGAPDGAPRPQKPHRGGTGRARPRGARDPREAARVAAGGSPAPATGSPAVLRRRTCDVSRADPDRYRRRRSAPAQGDPFLSHLSEAGVCPPHGAPGRTEPALPASPEVPQVPQVPNHQPHGPRHQSLGGARPPPQIFNAFDIFQQPRQKTAPVPHRSGHQEPRVAVGPPPGLRQRHPSRCQLGERNRISTEETCPGGHQSVRTGNNEVTVQTLVAGVGGP